MCIKNVIDYSTSILIDPCGKDRSYKLQATAWIATIAVGIATLGTAQALSSLWRLNNKIEKNYTHDKISRLYHIAIGQSDVDIAFSLTDQRFLNKLGTGTQANLETVKEKITKQGSSIDRFIKDKKALEEVFKYEEYRHAFYGSPKHVML